MGDGINDAPALRAADVGISVDTAVDIAKESADMILLEKNLMVLEEGVLEGRKVFANILKYIRMGASSNFGNVFSMVGASAWLKFSPMWPLQLLTNNLLYDFSQVPIPTDNVSAQVIAKPRPWQINEITRFMLFIGPISSIFDYSTFCVMLFFFKCNNLGLVPPPELLARFANVTDPDQSYAAALFHTGWFVESLMTQTLIIHVIRTNWHSVHPVARELATDDDEHFDHVIGAVSAVFAAGPAARLRAAAVAVLAILAATLLCYVILTQLIKMWLVKKKWI